MRKPKAAKSTVKSGKRLIRYIVQVGILLVGVLIGFFIHELLRLSGSPMMNDLHMYRLGGYKFISPLLTCDTPPEALDYIRVHPLRKEIEKKIAALKEARSIVRASVYFRLLGDGRWFVLGENELYEPASLVKIPVMIATLKKEEMDPSFTEKRIKFTGSPVPTITQNFKPSKLLEVGKYYSIDDLLLRDVAYSDNDAYWLLLEQIGSDLIQKTCNDLLFPWPYQHSRILFVSVSDVANSFRILYNSAYLGEKMSEKALDMLSKTDFKEGIVRGVTSNLVVAHKFGERGEIDNSNRELHDCGIVYYPGTPYLLCVMTEGTSFKTLSDAIADISLVVYEGIGRYWKQAGK